MFSFIFIYYFRKIVFKRAKPFSLSLTISEIGKQKTKVFKDNENKETQGIDEFCEFILQRRFLPYMDT